MRGRIAALMALCALLAAAAGADTAHPVPVYVDGRKLSQEGLLLQQRARTILPMRTLFQALGAEVEWDSSERAVYAWKPDGTGVRLPLGAEVAQTLKMDRRPGPGHWGDVTGQYHLSAQATLVQGRVYVPLRFAAEALHADVKFAEHEPAVHINTGLVAGSRDDRRDRDEERDREAERERQAERDRQAELEKRAELEKQAERDRQPELEKQAQRDRDAERKREAERQRQAERERQERERQAERQRQAERDRDRRQADRDRDYRRDSYRDRDGDRIPADDASPREAARDLELRLVTNRRLRRDRIAHLALMVRNLGDRRIRIPFSGEQQYDFEVLMEGDVVWRWSRARRFSRTRTMLTLEPGDQASFEVEWDLRDQDGVPLPSGEYEVRGLLTASAPELRVQAEKTVSLGR